MCVGPIGEGREGDDDDEDGGRGERGERGERSPRRARDDTEGDARRSPPLSLIHISEPTRPY